jgi:hypothetical protein
MFLAQAECPEETFEKVQRAAFSILLEERKALILMEALVSYCANFGSIGEWHVGRSVVSRARMC